MRVGIRCRELDQHASKHLGTIVIDADGTVQSIRVGALPTASFSVVDVRGAIARIAQSRVG